MRSPLRVTHRFAGIRRSLRCSQIACGLATIPLLTTACQQAQAGCSGTLKWRQRGVHPTHRWDGVGTLGTPGSLYPGTGNVPDLRGRRRGQGGQNERQRIRDSRDEEAGVRSARTRARSERSRRPSIKHVLPWGCGPFKVISTPPIGRCPLLVDPVRSRINRVLNRGWSFPRRSGAKAALEADYALVCSVLCAVVRTSVHSNLLVARAAASPMNAPVLQAGSENIHLNSSAHKRHTATVEGAGHSRNSPDGPRRPQSERRHEHSAEAARA